jgi:hypothetical protein
MFCGPLSCAGELDGAPNFDDARWPQAFEFTDQDVGVVHIQAYAHYPEAFAGAGLGGWGGRIRTFAIGARSHVAGLSCLESRGAMKCLPTAALDLQKE